jgi:RNA polymerase sigma-70 factor (ECF subfamily)
MQDLLTDLLQRLPAYDSAKAHPRTFASRLIDHCIANMVEARLTAKRGAGRKPESLDVPVRTTDGDTGCSRIDLVDEDTYLQRTQHSARNLDDLRDLRIDIEAALGHLPDDLRDLCERLQLETITEVAQSTGIPKSTLYDRIAQIREALLGSGLADHFGTCPTFRRRFR